MVRDALFSRELWIPIDRQSSTSRCTDARFVNHWNHPEHERVSWWDKRRNRRKNDGSFMT
jgi:hypothetical protein